MKSRTLLVTGGNRGIGLAIVKALSLSSQDIVLLGCRDVDAGTALAKEIGDNVKAVALDLSNREPLKDQCDKILKDYGSIDVLVNNAGILNEGSYDKINLKKFDEALRVNSVAPYELIRAFTPEMIKNNYGRIVNISSGWGSFDDGLSGPFSYSVSKATLNAMTLTIAKELPKNVKINSMCPGWVRTRMGGMMANRSPEEASETALWLSNLDEEGPSGGFYRDKRLIEW